MMMIWENDENLKSKGTRCQSFAPDLKRGDGSSERKGHQHLLIALGVSGGRLISRRAAETRRVGERNEVGPEILAKITDECPIIFEKVGVRIINLPNQDFHIRQTLVRMVIAIFQTSLYIMVQD